MTVEALLSVTRLNPQPMHATGLIWKSCCILQQPLIFSGCLQAIPYCWTLMYVPMHFLTHELLLFATGVWTTNIHDCIHGR